MKAAEADPRISCPIVCGEYMRATGFFYESGEQPYLITARHNVLPTDADALRTGQVDLQKSTTDFLPNIDIYLQSSTDTSVETIDIRDIDGVKSSTGIDILGIPVEFNPREFDYVVWSTDDIVAPDSAVESLESIGYPGSSFPPSEVHYTKEQYGKSPITPHILRLINDGSNFGGQTDLVDSAAEEEHVGEASVYTGFSGSPVLGEGLVGVHSWNATYDMEKFEQHGFEPCNLIFYWPAVILRALLD